MLRATVRWTRSGTLDSKSKNTFGWLTEHEMEFFWNDGGRSACGFVGLAGDCVTRSIAIATGLVYRDVYNQLGAASLATPRNGVRTDIAAKFLEDRRWHRTQISPTSYVPSLLPAGAVIVHLAKNDGRCSHFSALIDHVVHDTWDPSDEDDYYVYAYWTHPDHGAESVRQSSPASRSSSTDQDLTQAEFDKILNRLRAMDRTASNSASTEAEKHNAIRMMQSLMLRHNLSREDITSDDNVETVQFTRIACPVNGSKAYNWEKSLASYITDHVLPTTQWYISSKAHRTLFCFYGPLADVRNAIALFRELLVTIAAAAKLQFGGHSRGSGASYAEGYVTGLPRPSSSSGLRTQNDSKTDSANIVSERALIQLSKLAIHSAAKRWLNIECDLQLISAGRSGRYSHDDVAERRGILHGSKHEVVIPHAPKRLTQS
jgi:hypothetical protein